jgi:hypothetical protein
VARARRAYAGEVLRRRSVKNVKREVFLKALGEPAKDFTPLSIVMEFVKGNLS